MKAESLFSLTGAEAVSILDRLLQAVLVADDSRTYVYANLAACELLRLPKDQLVGRRIDDFVPESFRALVAPQWETFLTEGLQHGGYQLLCGDATLRDVEFTAIARIQANRHISFIRDVTDEKRLREAQIESERIAQLALHAQRMGRWHWNSRTNQFASNPMLGVIFGLAPDQPADGWEIFLDALHPDDREHVRQTLGGVFLNGNEYELEYRVCHPNGNVRYITDRGHALFDPVGQRIGLLGVCWDVTDRRTWETSLRRSESRFRSLVEQSPFGTQLFSPDGTSRMVNRAWIELWGRESDEPPPYNILHDQQLIDAGVMPLIKCAFAGTEAELPVISYRPHRGRFAGTTVWIRSFIYPVSDDEGHVREVVIVHEDVSGSKRLELERARQAEELARSNAELQRFVYIASHDLKEPLRNMMAFSQLLLARCQNKLDSDDLEYISHILEGSRRMSALMDGLLDYSRASFVRDIVLIEANFNDLLHQATENLRVAVSQTGALITSSPLPTVRCIPLNIVQLFQNLIGNSIKYAGPSQPRIHISSQEDSDSWIIRVSDNGIGIEPAFHEQIFGVFTRLHSREYAGTGIGLAICKAIVEKHHGRIWVESEKGAGARFFFALPK